jgi:uncharacterized protein (TIGR02145 family)
MHSNLLGALVVCIGLAGCGGGGASLIPASPTTLVAATPVFTPAAGAYTSAQSVTLSDSTSAASIYYTTNGTAPTTSSTLYTGAITVSSTTTIEAIAAASGYTSSAVASGTFTIGSPSTPVTTVKDVDGNVYDVVQIGTQYWTQQNLATTHFSDGTAIPLASDATTWSGLTTPAFGYYNFDKADNGPTYGALYNWYAATTGTLCPAGWHVPTSGEWQTLFTFEGGMQVAGGPLKSTSSLWEAPNTGATNSSGFTALPGGGIDGDGSSGHLTQYAKFWSTTAGTGSETALPYYLGYDGTGVGPDNYAAQGGLSIRCLQN